MCDIVQRVVATLFSPCFVHVKLAWERYIYTDTLKGDLGGTIIGVDEYD